VPVEYNIAQLLVAVPEDAAPAVVAERQAVAEKALARALGGEPFEALVRELSSASKERGGEIGLRPANRLPDLFVERVRDLASGSVAPALVRSGAGFHVLKLVERRDGGSAIVTQTRARHILLRPSEQLGQSAAMARLADFKRQIESGRRGFEALAREHSEDGSAPQGGDLGWASPGQFVPEFEQAMNALPVNGLSEPVASRFGVHLIQVVDRRSATLDARQLREQARNVLREQKFEKAYDEWVRELRARAYIEMREPPL
jgi:peptidyl-prolyl cis-trans isomerase SurA